MTRDDLFWLAQRLLMLWLFYLGVTNIFMPPASSTDAASGKAGIVIPFLAALVLYGVTSRANPADGKREVHVSMRKEDLLWVSCKVFGLYLMAQSIESLVMLFSIAHAEFRGMSFQFMLPGVLVYGAAGAWLFFGSSPWLHGSKTRPPTD